MKDWVMDSSGDLQTRDLANPPLPTLEPGGTVTSPPTRSTGTVSGPGATPLTTSAGVVVWVSNENNAENTNEINIGNDGSSLSSGAIAGITVACTVVTAIAAVFGVWYARKQAKNKRGQQGAELPRPE
ncbi:hypothetical protein OQA88_13297 [Cercophora sp. LCS_1]